MRGGSRRDGNVNAGGRSMSAEEATAADGMEVEHPEPAAADGG